MIVVTYDALMKNGRLGNQAWQVAWQVGEAARLGGRPYVKADWAYRPLLFCPDEWFDPPRRGDRIIDGGTDYYQELRYFENVAATIQVAFSPSVQGFRDCGPLTAKLVAEFGDRPVCAVHVRRGDYLKNPGHFPLPTARYYQRAVADVQARRPGIGFAVFTDDPKWCRRNLAYLGLRYADVVVVDPVVTPVEVKDRPPVPGDHVDLFVMAHRCQEHILSNSTFAWWAAYLSDNDAPIYPSVWFGPPVPNWENCMNAMPDTWRRFDV